MPLEDRTEAPTPRKRQEARQEGQVAKSMELNSALVLLGGLLIVKFNGPWIVSRLKELAIDSFGYVHTSDFNQVELSAHLVRILLRVGVTLVPLLVGVAVIGFISSASQVGLVLSSKSLQMKGERLNPLPGIARMFSKRSFVELTKAIIKVTIIGIIVYKYIKDKYAEISSLATGDYFHTVSVIGSFTLDLLLRASIAMLIIAIFDYAYQRYHHEQQIKMTKQEVKEDYKRSEGDPLIKSRIKQRQREIVSSMQMKNVPTADVVVTNPTHYAVALKYDSEVSEAPVVVAKGQRLKAQKIKEIAKQHNVPMVENVQLARALYATTEVGDEIPADLYQAVAEILAYVYSLTKKQPAI
ncbi:MAG: flagellar biosynthesis protein FlhB [Armatimonadota bacterium]